MRTQRCSAFKPPYGYRTHTTPLFFPEPPEGINPKDVKHGDYNASLKHFAAQAAAFGQPIILAPLNEPNLNESAWGFGTDPNNTAAKFRLAWLHVHDLFALAPNVKF